MDSPWDFFDFICCINLPERTDRRERMEKVFESVGLTDVNWRDGVRVQCDTVHMRDGFVGCSISQKRLLEEARDSGARNILLFEDDLKFPSHDHCRDRIQMKDTCLNKAYPNYLEVPSQHC